MSDFSHLRNGATARAAFTLPEMMITAAIFSLLVIAGVYSHVLGLKMSNFTQTKLMATHNARAALNTTRDEIRSAQTVVVGNGNNTNFTGIADNLPQQGNAIQVYPTESTNTYVRFYVDTNSKAQTLNRVVSGKTNIQVLANFVTNQIPFRVEDFNGIVLTNDQNNRVVSMTFEFYQFEFAVLQSGKPAFYDYYRLQTKVARRAVP
jgi:prepilin-type N-terminal cleavage/methylation domain-containing protein